MPVDRTCLQIVDSSPPYVYIGGMSEWVRELQSWCCNLVFKIWSSLISFAAGWTGQIVSQPYSTTHPPCLRTSCLVCGCTSPFVAWIISVCTRENPLISFFLYCFCKTDLFRCDITCRGEWRSWYETGIYRWCHPWRSYTYFAAHRYASRRCAYVRSRLSGIRPKILSYFRYHPRNDRQAKSVVFDKAKRFCDVMSVPAQTVNIKPVRKLSYLALLRTSCEVF